MEAVLQTVLTGLPVLTMHVIATLAILAAGVWVYEKVTPYHEVQLIKDGNVAAAVTFSGAILGIAIPLAFAMNASIGLIDVAIWGVITVVFQSITFVLLDILMKDTRNRIEEEQMSAAVVMAAVKLAVGAILAAAVAG